MISRSLITANRIPIIDGQVDLGDLLYEYQFLTPIRKAETERLNRLFETHMNLIFKHRDVVLTRGIFYLLRPDYLSSGAAYSGGFRYCLGALCESFDKKSPFYFANLRGHKDLYLVRMSGSPLSGNRNATFWSDAENRMIDLDAAALDTVLQPVSETLKTFREKLASPNVHIDHQDRALEALIEEIRKKNGG
jgi:hypothetical protein